MKNRLPPLVSSLAIPVAVVAALVLIATAFVFLGRLGLHATPHENLIPIGQIFSYSGDVQHRLPHDVKIDAVTASLPLHSQELVLTGRASEAVLKFQALRENGKPAADLSLKLDENSRVVAELDSTKPDGIIVTVLEGNVSLAAGVPANNRLRIFKDGREQPLFAHATPVPQILREGPAPTDAGTTGPPPLIIATVGEEVATSPPPEATPPLHLPARRIPKKVGEVEETLTNDEISRQIGTQAPFLRRCYLTFVNRVKNTGAGTSGPTGTITVGFTIQSTGRVTATKLVRSDFKDETLHNCVLETIGRTSFRTFDASSIPVLEFPIKLQ